MSLSLYKALGLPQSYEYVRAETIGGVVRLYAAVREEQFVCPACGSWEVCRHGKRFREITMGPVESQRVYLVTEVPRCQCSDCGKCFEVLPH